MNQPTVSVVVITLDRPLQLAGCLDALAAQRRLPDEVVVVDNGPSQATRLATTRARGRLKLRYVSEARRGYGAARNRGIGESAGETILFTDDDCRPDPGWSAALLEVLEEHPEAGIVGGANRSGVEGRAALADYLCLESTLLSPQLPPGPRKNLSTSNMALRREAIRQAGLFDENLPMGEDRDLCHRVRQAGFEILFEPTAGVTHLGGSRSVEQYLDKMRRYGAGTLTIFRLHPGEEPLGRLYPTNPRLLRLLGPGFVLLTGAYIAAMNLRAGVPVAKLAGVLPLILRGCAAWHEGIVEAQDGPLLRAGP